MDPSAARYRIRLDNGSTIALGDGVHRIGRAQGNELVLAHPSVSSRHAEVRIGADGAWLVDLESTNGTRVQGFEVTDAVSLAHGDRILVGSAALVFEDGAVADLLGPNGLAPNGLGPNGLEASGVDAAPTAPPVSSLAARPRGRGRRLLLPGLSVVAIVIATLLWLRRDPWPGHDERTARDPASGARTAALDDGRFDDWSDAPEAPTRFAPTGASLTVQLDVDEWALARGPLVPAGAGASVAAEASRAVGGRARGRLGVELETSAGERLLVWGSTLGVTGERGGTGETEEHDASLGLPLPEGFVGARAVLAAAAARSGGTFSGFEPRLVVGPDAAAPQASFEEHRVDPAQPAARLIVQSRGRATLVVSGLEEWSDAGARERGVSWSATAGERGLSLRPSAALEGMRIAFGTPGAAGRAGVDGQAVEGADAGAEGWIATLGPGGHRSHGSAFEVEAATAVVVGVQDEVRCLRFAAPTALRGRIVAGALEIVAEPGGELELQLAFAEEHALARDLGTRARRAEERGATGEALVLWSRLLDEVPFERATFERAEAARGRLVAAGLARVEELRAELEDAAFFALPELHHRAAERAAELEAEWSGTEVAAGAAELRARIEERLIVLEAEALRARRDGLRAILAAREVAGSEALSRRVEGVLDELEAADAGPSEERR